ncbi:MAG: hypothetical protein IJS26_00005 [Alphaproteobacteria bacterium]|nr:hypothetical protein [Alphaproteobacteria bacterium]
MKLRTILPLIRAGSASDVDKVLVEFFKEQKLSEKEQSKLLDDLEKGDVVAQKILKAYLQRYFLEKANEQKLCALFKQGVTGAEELLKKAAQVGLYDDVSMEVLDLFKKGHKGAKEIVKADIKGYCPEKSQTGLFFELIECMEEGVSDSQELLETYIRGTHFWRSKDDRPVELARLYKKGIKGSEKLLNMYYVKATSLYPEEFVSELVECYKQKVDGAEDILLKFVKKHGLYPSHQITVVECFRNGFPGSKEILLGMLGDFCSDNWRFSKGAMSVLFKCFKDGVAGTQELLRKQFFETFHGFSNESQHKLFRLFEDGVAGARELLIECAIKKHFEPSTQDLFLKWFDKASDAQKKKLLARQKKIGTWLCWKAQLKLVDLWKTGFPDAEETLKVYIQGHHLDSDAENSIFSATRENVKGATEMVLLLVKRRASGYDDWRRAEIEDLCKNMEGFDELKKIFNEVHYFYYEPPL